MIIKLQPVLSEKTVSLAQGSNEYTFRTPRGMGKNEVRELVQKMFKVNVLRVRTKVVKGGFKAQGKKRLATKMSDYKLATVKLAEKQKIDLFDVKEAGAKK